MLSPLFHFEITLSASWNLYFLYLRGTQLEKRGMLGTVLVHVAVGDFDPGYYMSVTYIE